MYGHRIFSIGAAFGGLGIVLGAFGAHGLADTLEANGDRAVAAWDTASLYHLVAALAILACGLAANARCRGAWIAAALFGAGIVCFSGSLYAWSVTQYTPLVFVTPVGGVLHILGFLTLTLSTWNDCGAEPAD